MGFRGTTRHHKYIEDSKWNQKHRSKLQILREGWIRGGRMKSSVVVSEGNKPFYCQFQ